MKDVQKIRQALKISIFEVFEKMFFVFLEQADDFFVEEGVCKSSIQYRGRHSGSIEFLFTPLLAERMVRNLLLKEEGDVSEQDIEDCLKEAANMVCGNFLRIFDSSVPFDLTIPEFERSGGRMESEAGGTAEEVVPLSFQSDGGALSVILTEMES